MTIANWLTIAAILLGPLVAVQLTRILDARREAKHRKILIYRSLMATRAANLSPAHVESLNAIDLEFSGDNRREKSVREAWNAYLDLLNDTAIPVEQWGVRRVDLLTELLSEMGQCLGYKFDKVHIKNGVYSPRSHGELENDQTAIRRGFRELLEGSRPIPVVVKQEKQPDP